MAVLARNVNLAFELDPKKNEQFLTKTSKTGYQKAIERASSHQGKRQQTEMIWCTATEKK